MDANARLKAALKYKQACSKLTATLTAEQFHAASEALVAALRKIDCDFYYTRIKMRFPGHAYDIPVKYIKEGTLYGYNKEGTLVQGRIAVLYFSQLCELWNAIEKEKREVERGKTILADD